MIVVFVGVVYFLFILFNLIGIFFKIFIVVGVGIGIILCLYFINFELIDIVLV